MSLCVKEEEGLRMFEMGIHRIMFGPCGYKEMDVENNILIALHFFLFSYFDELIVFGLILCGYWYVYL